jgi:hypothetical protein
VFLPFGMAYGRSVASAAPHIARYTAGASTGLVPAMGEAAIFLSRTGRIGLHPTTAAGVAAGGVVGVANLMRMAYQNRGKLPRIFYDPKMEDGYHKPITNESRGRIGPTASHRTRIRSGLGKRRPRCKHVDKRGRRCLRPAGHSGRHRYV